MKRFLIFLFSSIFLLSGCVEDFDLKLLKAEPRLVVEGLITNRPGPYYIRLTKSKTGTFTAPTYSSISTAERVTDALVIISDDAGQVDTLQLIKTLDPNADKAWHEEEYKTSKLQGIPGRTYILKIKVWGKEFEAKSCMPPVPEIDSVGYFLKTSEKDGQKYYVPLLNFREPQGVDNYYLVQQNDEFSSNNYMFGIWQFSVLSDVHLPSYVRNLNINTGANPRGIEYPIYSEGSSIFVALSSLTKEAYNYYKALLDQFDNDGGAYKPTPTSPPTNISNGGLGLFRASAVSEKRTKIQ